MPLGTLVLAPAREMYRESQTGLDRGISQERPLAVADTRSPHLVQGPPLGRCRGWWGNLLSVAIQGIRLAQALPVCPEVSVRREDRSVEARKGRRGPTLFFGDPSASHVAALSCWGAG